MNSNATIQVTIATPTDQPEWDAFIQSQQTASPYHLFAWGTSISIAYGHKPYYLMAKHNDILLGVLPLIHLKLPYIVNQLVALPFCDVGNCLATSDIAQNQLLKSTVQLATRLNCKNIQLRGHLSNSEETINPFSLVEHTKVRMLRDLPCSSETLFNHFKSKLRSQIRKAEKNGVSFRWAGKEGVDPFYSVFCSNMRDLGSPVHSKILFQAILENFGNHSRIGLAEFDGKCIGAGLILSTNNQTSIPWASTLRSYNKLAPNMLIYWNFLKYAADNKIKVFDFGRSTENEGTYRFKKQWEAKPLPLTWYYFPSKTPKQENESHQKILSREKATKIWKSIPVPIANFFGPKLRKYISL